MPPSRTYTNTDADRQYGRGRTEFGPWKRLTPAVDPSAGLEDIGNIDDIIADSKALSGRLRVQAHRDRLESDERESQYDRAEESARAKSSRLTPFLTSVFSPEQRESTARWIEGDARDREGIGARIRSFAAGAIGGAGEGSEFGGLMGEMSPLNIGTGFGITRTGPLGTALRVARESQAVRGVREARRLRLPTVEGGPIPKPPTPMRTIPSQAEDAYGIDRGRREAMDPGTWDDIATEAPVRGGADVPPVRSDGSRAAFGAGLGRLRPRETPTVEEALADALNEARASQLPTRVSAPILSEIVPKSGTASGAESLARRAAQTARAPQPRGPQDWELMDDPALSVIDDAPVAQAPRNTLDPNDVSSLISGMRAGLGRLPDRRGAGARAALAGETPPPSIRSAFASETPTPRGGTGAPQTDPSRLLPAFGETAEGMAGQRLGVGRSRTRTLRPEATTLELANELAQTEIGPGARVASLKAYPRPTGSDELSKALRQRGYLSEKSRRGLGDQRGFAVPEGLETITSTGGGALLGGANPELVGADSDSHLQGALTGALFGTMAPGAVRGLGRIAKAVPRGAAATGKQAFDEVQNLRYQGALSGFAGLRSALGNVGSHLATSLERGSVAPLRRLFSKQTGRDWLARFKDPRLGHQTMEEAAAREPNIFGRIMGAGDYAATRSLEDIGLSTKGAERALLRTPTAQLFGADSIPEAVLKSRFGKAGMLFQTTPLNQIIHGANAFVGHKLPDGLSVNRARAIAAGAMGLGGIQGYQEGSDPLEISMTAPLAGAYSAPYLAGAAGGMLARGATSLSRGVLRGVSPVPELGADIIPDFSGFADGPVEGGKKLFNKYFRPITDPAIGAWFNQEQQNRRRTRSIRARRNQRTRE